MSSSFIPSAYTQYPILIKSCTCGRRLGCFQKEIEEEIIEQQKTVPNLQEARKIVLEKMGITKICCIDQIVNCPKLFIHDGDGDSYTDITILQNNVYQNNRYVEPYNISSWGWIPLKRNAIEFDETKYCQNIYNSLFGSSINVSSVFSTFPLFPKIYPQPIPEAQKNL
jgi:DNA-directed RNA polymerase subunit N (RpoN/RPB10)